MNTTHAATRQPSQNPMDLVHVETHTLRLNLLGQHACQALTRDRKACNHKATTTVRASGPAISRMVNLCDAHAFSHYVVDADPSL